MKKIVSGITLTLLLMGMLASASNIQLTKAESRLIDYLQGLVNAINFGDESADTIDYRSIYAGMMFGKNTTADLENLIDAYGNDSTKWKHCLFLSSWAKKFGIERETAIKYALGNATMTSGGLPITSTTSFVTSAKYALMGFYWAIEYDYLLDKWNLTKAYENFEDAFNAADIWHEALYEVINSTNYRSGSDRFYDEFSSTMQCFLIFDWLNVSQALNNALKIWDRINELHWVEASTRPHYGYTPESVTYECEAGFFLQDVALLNHRYFSMENWNRVLQDFKTRFLVQNWSSYQWLDNMNKTTYVVVHAYWYSGGNPERRLENTLGAWFTMLGTYQLFKDTEKETMRNMIEGFGSYAPAWQLLLSEEARLFNPSSFKFKMDSTPPTADSDVATSYGLALMYYLGIIPYTGMIAMPLEDYGYEYVQVAFDPDLFTMDFSTCSIKIAVYNGTLGFQYGTALCNCTFAETGVYNVTFSSDWNSVTSAIKLSDLPSNRIFLKEMTHDITLADITPWKTVAGQGSIMKINVTLENTGGYSEIFNVTLYANTTIIATITNVTLSSWDTVTTIFTWNTTDFARAYVISANVSAVIGETDLTDNTFVYGIVKVSCLGDLNGDYITDAQDYQLIKSAIPSNSSSSNWNPNAELNDDGIVDGQDLQIVKNNIPSSFPP